MSHCAQDEFADFASGNCARLVADLIEVLGAPLQVLDPRGGVIPSSSGKMRARAKQAPHGSGCIRVPIRGVGQNQEQLGSLKAITSNSWAEPLISTLAAEIGRRFQVERDIRLLTDQLEQCDEEIELLSRFTRIPKPGEEFAHTARKLLRETTDLLGRRLIILYQAEGDIFDWSTGANCIANPLPWLTSNNTMLGAIHARLIQGTEDLAKAAHSLGVLDSHDGPRHYVAALVRAHSDPIGFVGLFRTNLENDFETGEMRLLECLSNELSNTAARCQLNQELRDMLFNTVKSLVAAIDAKDKYTHGHSQHVHDISVEIGQRLGLSSDEIQALSWAALLHDIGKIAITGEILNKLGKLSQEDFKAIKTHPVEGCKVLEPIPQLHEVLPIIRHHHEHFNGKGYPDGLKGDQIPLAARIIAVADAYDAITSTRRYREARTHDFALKEIQDCAGTQFDPEIAGAFLELAVEEGFKFIEPGDMRAAA